MSFIFLGAGNLHRADDGIGPLMAERLADDKTLKKKKVRVESHSGEGVSLMQIWEGADKVVIVDAMKSGQKLGSLHRFDAVKETLYHGVFRYSSHLFGLAEAVELSRQLDKLPKAMTIFGVEGVEFTFGAEMSPEVAARIPELEKLVRGEF